jgi:hypothetical protein
MTDTLTTAEAFPDAYKRPTFLTNNDRDDPLVAHHFGVSRDFLIDPATMDDLGARVVAEALADHAGIEGDAQDELRGMAFGEDPDAEEQSRENWLAHEHAWGG